MTSTRETSDSDARSRAVELWRPRVLDYLESHTRELVNQLSDLVREPSVSGTDEENSIQHRLAAEFKGLGLAVDYWQIPLGETLSAPDFPGVEVERLEAWGLVGRAPGRGDGLSLMLNAHVDVVPPGDLGAWGDQLPFTGALSQNSVSGRGACDMKGGLVAALWAVRTLTELKRAAARGPATCQRPR